MVQFTSPVGRFVQGSAFDPQLKDQQGNPRVIKTGPNAGQPAPQWFMALAFAKTDPAWPTFHALLMNEAATAWPSLFPSGAAGPCVLPTFASKIIDGDGYDTTGKSNATKEGFAGHWIVRFTSGYAPKVYPAGRYAPADLITTPALLRTGYFVRIAGSVVSNQNPTKPGLYVNIALVELAGHGTEIVQGPDAAAAFAAPAALPAGASPTPIAAGPLPGGGAAPPPPAATAPPPPPAAPYAGYRDAAPALNAGPLYTMVAGEVTTREQYLASGWTDDLLVQHGKMTIVHAVAPPPAAAAAAAPPTAPAAPPPPPAAPVRTMLPAAGGQTYEAMIAAGWNDAQLVQHGMMAA